MNFEVLYEDNHLIVVLKKPGVLMQQSKLKLPVLLDDVKKYLVNKYQKQGDAYLGMVHRIDTNVGGVVCFAKTSKAASRISKEIREDRFIKKYYAVVEGNILSNNEITLTNYLRKDSNLKKALITNNELDQKSILKYRKIKTINNLSLLEVNLITGRFHQIRSQLSHIGIPIYGDTKYGAKSKSEFIALHAYSLSFKHPTKDEVLTIKHMPKDNIFEIFFSNK